MGELLRVTGGLSRLRIPLKKSDIVRPVVRDQSITRDVEGVPAIMDRALRQIAVPKPLPWPGRARRPALPIS